MTGPMPVLSDQNSRATRSWPAYLFGGRLRTSTLALIIAFIAIWWLYETYEPAVHPREQVPATEVVPPGFVPDPSYTWVPRTDVQRQVPTTIPTTTPTESPTTTPTTTESTSTPGASGQPTTTGSSAPLSPEPSATSSAPASAPSTTPAQSPTASLTSTTVPLPPLTHPTAMPSTPTPATQTP